LEKDRFHWPQNRAEVQQTRKLGLLLEGLELGSLPAPVTGDYCLGG